MFKALTVLVFIQATAAMAEIREIYLPTLDCDDKFFQDVSVNFDDAKTKKADLTISMICQRLRKKVQKKAVVADLSRFVIDKLAPQEVDRFAPRANEFFKLILFKPDVIGREKFSFSEDSLAEIIDRLKSPKFMRLRTFDGSRDNGHVFAYQSEGAAYLNSDRLNRKSCSLINTLVHEYMHFVGYSHGDNDPQGKNESIPYYFGDRAQELCEAGVI